jgi:hypothetical protein
MDFTTNYCGPYYSNGKLQKSVIGDRLPVNALDHCCFVHDALYSSSADTSFADNLFIKCTNNIDDVRAPIYANLVKYVNHPRMALNFLGRVIGLGAAELAVDSGLLSDYDQMPNQVGMGVRETGKVAPVQPPAREYSLAKRDFRPIDFQLDTTYGPEGYGHVANPTDDGKAGGFAVTNGDVAIPVAQQQVHVDTPRYGPPSTDLGQTRYVYYPIARRGRFRRQRRRRRLSFDNQYD